MTTEKATTPSTNENGTNRRFRILIFTGANRVIRKLITEHGEIFPYSEDTQVVVITLTKVPKKRIPRFEGKTIFILDLSYNVVVGDELRKKKPLGDCEVEALIYPRDRNTNLPLAIKKSLLTIISKHITCS